MTREQRRFARLCGYENTAALKAAHEAGINYIDTARAYTVSEEWIGQALEELGLRDEFILATKCRALTKAEMEAELAASLKNLRTDHIDLYQFHNPSPENLDKILAPGGAMEALLEAKAKGVKFLLPADVRVAMKFEDGAEVTAEILCNAGIVKNALDGIKILGNGALTKKLTVKAAAFSASAKEKIEAAGGKAEVV